MTVQKNWSGVNLSTLWEMVKDREAWHAAVHVVAELDMTWQLNNNKYTQNENISKIHSWVEKEVQKMI